MIDKLSTQSLKVLYNTLKMGVLLDIKGELDIEKMRVDIGVLDIELKKREKGDK